jgi:FLVCR family MFS transporter
MAAPSALSAAWFPANERATAISISQTAYIAGNGVSFLLGPLVVPDKFLNKTCKNDYSPIVPLTNFNETYPTSDEEKQLVWYYMVAMAAFSISIFVAMIIYFPSKPKSPPTASASDKFPRLGFAESLSTLFKNRDVIFCFVAFSFSTGVQGAWATVMTLNFEIIGGGERTSGYIGVAVTVATIFIGIAVGKFVDCMRNVSIKLMLILILVLSTLGYIWLTLLILKVIPYSLTQLYISTICGTGFVTAIMTLFFEYTVEMSYPVPEGLVGGLLTTGNNVVSLTICESIFVS